MNSEPPKATKASEATKGERTMARPRSLRRAGALIGLGVAAAVCWALSAELPGFTQLTEGQAVDIAASYLGLGDLSGLDIVADRVTPTGDNTPILHELINGRKCWVVSFGGLKLSEVVDDTTYDNPFISRLNVLLDAESGQLLKAWSTEWLDPPTAWRTAAEADAIVDGVNEEWHGLPDTLPKVGLLQALSESAHLPRAEQLDVVYVSASYLTVDGWLEAHPTWMITTRASRLLLPANWSTPEQLEPYPIYGRREVIDGETGASHFSTGQY
jgi:hypothetical protein